MVNNKELWKIFTVKEEYNSQLKDKYNRNNYWNSQNRNIFSPIVSEYLIENGLKPYYPNNKSFALCLTHDIDRLYDIKNLKLGLKIGIKSLWPFNIKELSRSLRACVKKEINPKFHISETLKLEKKYNAKSSFYFLALSKEEESYNYNLTEIAEIFAEITQNQGEIGLHGGFFAYNNLAKLKQEKEKLENAIGKPIYGYRNHYLKFETPTTWENLDELNFAYDTTFGFADCVGFRNGMCHPFQPFSLNKNAFLNIFELPLIIMDGSLWNYMKLNETTQFDICKNLIDTVAKSNGVLTLVWHNTKMHGHEGQLYNAILKYANEKGAWLTTGKEIIDFWKENKFHEITNDLLNQLNPNSP